MDFIVVKVYSPYTTILARPWLHAMGAIFSTLHLKVKYPTEGKACELLDVNCSLAVYGGSG